MQKRSTVLDVFLVLQVLVVLALGINIAITAGVFGDQKGSSFADLEITLLTTPECPTCFDLQPLREYLTQNGVDANQINETAFDSKEGSKLVKKYEIDQVPTAVIVGPYGEYEFMAGLVGSIAEVRDKALVITKLQPPFWDLTENKVRGEFELVYVTDLSCTECYDANLHEDVLERMAMTPSKSSVVDIGSDEGRALVDEYVLTSVPTILLRGDLEPFDQLQEIWSLVGTKEQDGTYVLRQGVASMGTYKQLPSGEIVKAEEPQI
jgi:hypothetical protein